MNAINKPFVGQKRIRKSFGRIPEIAEMPNLIDVQRSSYEGFLQMVVPPDSRTQTGLQEVFKSVFPIDDFAGRGRLEFVNYELEEPKYDVEECIQRGMTYAAPLKVVLRLIVWDLDEDTGARSIRDIKEQPVYMGDMPLMTDNGTFVINGTERVIVSQMHRSPGVFFDHDKGKTHSSGKYLFAARVIPYRGSWLDFEFDSKDLVYVRIDRKRKLPVTTLLYALEGAHSEQLRAAREAKGETVEIADMRGMGAEEILDVFYGKVPFTLTPKGWARPFDAEAFRGMKLLEPMLDADTGEVVAEAEAKLTARSAKKIAEKTKSVLVSRADVLGRFVAEDLVNEQTGEVYADAGEELVEAKLAALEALGITEIPTLAVDQQTGPWIRNTLAVDKNTGRDDALIDIYRVMRPGEPPTPETAEKLFQGLFFESDRYDLSAVGRVKMNMRLGQDVDDSVRILRKEDILRTVKTMCELKDGRGQIDDIDNLGNRRVRSVGELMENQYRLGLLRMERAIRERMGSVDIDTVMPHDLINAKPAAAAVREFFGSSQLSQFMDQTNPLSEVTHKRRLSALGPGGLTRERAGFEVRDVHPTHYGRICPIETPEGPNIGLINSLATFAKVNKYGFIETPYMLVKDGVVQRTPRYLSAMEEERLVVAQADAPMDAEGRFTEELVSVRRQGDFRLVKPEDVTAIDVSPKQLVSVAAALIPFLENDDANRALMGSNMQRQAVPLIRADAPLVGTGMEAAVARDSGATIVAKRPGVVDQIDGARIVVRATADDGTIKGVDIYRLRKFMRSNQSTCINQRPLVRVGDRVNTGDIIADGPSTELGELALGRNVLCAFMPWNGYNFEDSILISERIARDDVFTSIHIEEFEVMARDTKLGQEEITRDIPNVGEEALKNMDEAGHRLHRRRGEPRRHPRRQGHPEGREPDDAGGEAAPRHLRREGVRRARHLAQAAAGRHRHDRRRPRVQPPRRRQGRARHGDRARRDRASGQGPRRRAGDPGAFVPRPPAREAARPQGQRRLQGHQVRHHPHRGRAGRASPRRLAQHRRAGRRRDGRDRDAEARIRRGGRPHRRPLRRQGREAPARRRAAARRDEDGQGVRGREAQAAAGRQDGRPPRQQGRGVARGARSRTCRSSRTAPRSTSC